MKKILLAIVLLGGTVSGASAQSKEGGKFSIGAEVGLPVGSVSDISKVVVGGSLKYELPVAESTFITLSAGYNNFLYKSPYSDYKKGEGFIPVKAGAKFYLKDGLYAEGQVGAAFATASGGGTAFAYAPGIGYTFGSGLEAGVRYEAWSKDGTVSQFGLRVGFRF